MSRAEELAQAYADAVSTHRLESLYGTSKSYTLEKSRERDEAHDALTAELRRLAQVEADHEALLKAISDAEPVAWKVSIPDEPELGDWFAEDPCGDGYTNMPLYTLEGIRTKP